ncbi:MAG: hypothetical protein R3D44_11010 [Hyphomicrobiaceae bacterium]
MERLSQNDRDDPLGALTLAIRRHPRFNEAARKYVGRVVEWRRGLGYFNRAGTNLGFHVINYVAFLHFAARNRAVEHGATVANLLRICETRENCGQATLRTVLTALTLLGRLKTGRSESDRRIQVFVPSDTLMREMCEVYGFSLGVLDDLLQNTACAHKMIEDPDFIGRVVYGSGRAIIEDDVRITEPFPELHEIITMPGGLPTSVSLAAASMTGTAFPAPHAIAKDFKLSTSQVRSVLNALVDFGLVARGIGGQITETGRLVDDHKSLIARELALHVKYALGLEHRISKAVV